MSCGFLPFFHRGNRDRRKVICKCCQFASFRLFAQGLSVLIIIAELKLPLSHDPFWSVPVSECLLKGDLDTALRIICCMVLYINILVSVIQASLWHYTATHAPSKHPNTYHPPLTVMLWQSELWSSKTQLSFFWFIEETNQPTRLSASTKQTSKDPQRGGLACNTA